MFWHLYLAHLIADYPFQTENMVVAKRTKRGLLVHVTIHLLMMVILTGWASGQIWPFLLLVTAAHFGIDSFKNILYRWRPTWVIAPYWIDQVLHLSSLLLVTAWIRQAVPEPALPFQPFRLAYISGYLLVTYIWFITERILAYNNPIYLKEITAQLWPRMIMRGILFTLFLWAWGISRDPTVAALLLSFPLPYLSGSYRTRALAVDVAVPLAMAILLRWVI